MLGTARAEFWRWKPTSWTLCWGRQKASKRRNAPKEWWWCNRSSGVVPSCNTEKPGSSLPAPCQPAYSAATLSQRQSWWGWARTAVIDAGSPTCSFSRAVTSALPPTLTEGTLKHCLQPPAPSLAAVYQHAWLERVQLCPFLSSAGPWLKRVA